MDVLVNQVDGLGTECVPDEAAVPGSGLDGLINLGEPAVVWLKGEQIGVGWKAREKVTPSWAMRSMCGVRTSLSSQPT